MSAALVAADRVRTPEGARKYGQPIGTVITKDIIEAAARRAAKVVPSGAEATRVEAARQAAPSSRDSVRQRIRNWFTAPDMSPDAQKVIDGFNPRTFGSDQQAGQYALGEAKPGRFEHAAGRASHWSTQGRELIIADSIPGFHEAQAAIRKGDTDNPQAKQFIARFQRNSAPIPDDLLVSRRVAPDAFPDGVEGLAGKEVHDTGYFPGNLGTPIGTTPVLLTVAVPKGTRAMFTGNGPNDRGVILDRDQRLRITKVTPDGKGGWYVAAVVIPRSEAPAGELREGTVVPGAPSARRGGPGAPPLLEREAGKRAPGFAQPRRFDQPETHAAPPVESGRPRTPTEINEEAPAIRQVRQLPADTVAELNDPQTTISRYRDIAREADIKVPPRIVKKADIRDFLLGKKGAPPARVRGLRVETPEVETRKLSAEAVGQLNEPKTTVAQLRKIAKDHGVKIPSTVTRKADIRAHLMQAGGVKEAPPDMLPEGERNRFRAGWREVSKAPEGLAQAELNEIFLDVHGGRLGVIDAARRLENSAGIDREERDRLRARRGDGGAGAEERKLDDEIAAKEKAAKFLRDYRLTGEASVPTEVRPAGSASWQGERSLGGPKKVAKARASKADAKRVRGRDITGDRALVAEAFEAGKEDGEWGTPGGLGAQRGGRWSEQGGYQAHLVIARRQGFDGKPRVLTGKEGMEEFSRLEYEGYTPLFRGWGWGGRKTSSTGREQAAQYLYGPLHVGGGHGLGTNMSSSLRTAVGYSSSSGIIGDVDPEGHAHGFLLRRDAKVASYPKLKAEHRRYLDSLGPDAEEERKVFEDIGTYAMARGYDAMVVRPGESILVREGRPEEWVVFNRSAVVALDQDGELAGVWAQAKREGADTTPPAKVAKVPRRQLDLDARTEREHAALQRLGRGESVPEESPTKKATSSAGTPRAVSRLSRDELEKFNESQLRVMARNSGIHVPAGATKAEIIDALAGVSEVPNAIEIEIGTAYSQLASRPGARVSLVDLRQKLSHISRSDFDATLKLMATRPSVYLESQENQQKLTPEDRTAVARIGRREYHFLVMEVPRAPHRPATTPSHRSEPTFDIDATTSQLETAKSTDEGYAALAQVRGKADHQRLADRLGVEYAKSDSISTLRDAILRHTVTRRLEHDAYLRRAHPGHVDLGEPGTVDLFPTFTEEQLRHIAQARGIHVPADATKAEIAQLLTAGGGGEMTGTAMLATPHSTVGVRPALAEATGPRTLVRATQAEFRRITGRDLTVDLGPDPGLSLPTAQEHMEGVLRAAEAWPDVDLREVRWFNGELSEPGQQRPWAIGGNGAIMFNTAYTSKAGRDRYLQELAASVAGWDGGGSGFHPRGAATPAAVAMHEIGHLVAPGRAAREYPGVRALVARRAKEDRVPPSRLIRREVSLYADTNPSELVAEAVLDVLINGDAAGRLAREIVELLRTGRL